MEGRGGGGGGGSGTGGGGRGGEEKQVVAAATAAAAGQALTKQHAARREGREKREVEEEEEQHQLVPVIPYTRPPPLNRKARSYTVLDLNGTQTEVRDRWRRSVLDYRLWCYNNSDKRYEFGHRLRRCCTLPRNGHFLIYMHHSGKWLCAVIDGPSGYLYGYITRSVGKRNEIRIRENAEKEKHIENAKTLPWDGGYETQKLTRCGDLVPSFSVMYRHVEEQEPAPKFAQVIRAGEVLILHFTEAAKSDNLYIENLFRNYRAGNLVGDKSILQAREWRTSCEDVYSALGIKEEEFDDDYCKRMITEDSSRKKMTTAKSVTEAKKRLANLRLLYRPNHKSGYFLLKDMPMQLTKDGPMDPLWAESELKESRKLDLDNENWNFLTQHFIEFSSTNIDDSTRKLVHNAYMDTEDLIGDKLVAYHESGHAIVALHTEGAHPIHKVTVAPQGSYLGLVSQIAAPDNAPISKKQILARLDVCLGGIIAQELIFGEEIVIAGAEQDLVTARELVNNMVSVSDYWMSGDADPTQAKESPSAGEMESRILGESNERVKLLLQKVSGDADPTQAKESPSAGEMESRILGESNERVKLLLQKHVNQVEAVPNARLDVCLRGRVAQDLIFGEQSVIARAEQDPARDFANSMVSNYWMSCDADPMQVKQSPSAGEMESRILRESYERVKLLLKKHVIQLEAVANALLDKETLTADEVLKIVDQCEHY